MAERTLKKIRDPKLPCLLLRPSIIGAAYRDPMPGWTDTLSAAGSIGVASAVGAVKYFNLRPE
jgi:glycerone phosphate O-acyltransferase/fatty acyl-CoA reductase